MICEFHLNEEEEGLTYRKVILAHRAYSACFFFSALLSVLNCPTIIAQKETTGLCDAQVNRSQGAQSPPCVVLQTELWRYALPLSFLDQAIDSLCVCLCY